MARVHVEIEQRWGDQDAYGHVNNVVFVRYLEEARVRVFWRGTAREKTGMERHFRGDDPESGLKTLVVNHQIEYVQILEYSDSPVTVELWIGKLGGSSLEVHYEIIDGAQETRTVVARAITTIVVVDGKTMRPVRLSADGRKAVQPWQDEPLQLRR